MLWERASATALAVLSALKRSEQPSLAPRATGTVDNYISTESPVAIAGILANIGPNGTNAPGADPGIVVASPSQVDPNYFYTWTRDSALTFKYLIDSSNASLQRLIEDYVIAQSHLQTVVNPSGDLATGAGLAEPKYYVNETAFLGSWGRPQRDGPALRATALISYANDRLALGQNSTAKDIIWPVVQNDLAYIAQYWNNSGFDLWEETNGSSFFTTAVQHRALVEGANFATAIGESCPNCESQAPQILCFMQDYWNGSNIIANIQVQEVGFNRSGYDCNSILASIHTFDPSPSVGCDATTFQPCSDRALANHKAVVDSFRTNYTINHDAPAGQAAAIGRYPEDFYQGGNPWYLCTFAAAEQLYDALYTYNTTKNVTITDVSLPFFTDLLPTIKTGTYASITQEYTNITTALRTYADGFVSINEKYTPTDGGLAEQFSRENGTVLSAVNLTWSYASFLTMQRAREGNVGPSWGATNVSILPDQCVGGGVKGAYSTPTATVFPASEEGTAPSGTGTGTATSSGSAASATSKKSAGHRIKPFPWL